MVSDFMSIQPNSQFLIYQTKDGQNRFEVRQEDETINFKRAARFLR